MRQPKQFQANKSRRNRFGCRFLNLRKVTRIQMKEIINNAGNVAKELSTKKKAFAKNFL